MTKNEERDIEIVQMHQAKLSNVAIAEEMDVSVSTVKRVLKEAGLKAQPRDAGLPIAQIIDEYQTERPIKAILGQFEISYTKLYMILAENDVPVRRDTQAIARERQLDEAVAMYKMGSPLYKIVADTGVSQPTLHAELHKREVPLRRPRK